MPVKVLVIDDDVGFTKLLKLNLEMDGEFDVCVQNDPLNARSSALEFSPEVVLLDVIMPSMAGADVVRQFKGEPKLKDIPIIMVTALAVPKDLEEAPCGIVLPKPIKIDILKSNIMKLVFGQ